MTLFPTSYYKLVYSTDHWKAKWQWYYL